MTQLRRVCAVLGLTLLATGVLASSPFVGNWQGAIDPAEINIEIAVNFIDTNEGLTASLSIPAQGLVAAPLELLEQDGDNIILQLPDVPGEPTFLGELAGDVLEGTFTQGAQELDFMLTRSLEVQAAALATIDAYMGLWLGNIYQDGESILDISVTFQDEDGVMVGEIDIPAQSYTGPLQIETATEAAINFVMAGIPGVPTFAGQLSGSQLVGVFTQGDATLEFSLQRRTE
ncbi:MAG: hypothetical protein AAF267_22820 [Deinococcota bacterium]